MQDTIRYDFTLLLAAATGRAAATCAFPLSPLVVRATEEYLEAEDNLSAWMEERCRTDKRHWVASQELWYAWKAWAEDNGEYVGSHKWFSQRLEERGFKRSKQYGQRGAWNCWAKRRDKTFPWTHLTDVVIISVSRARTPI